MKVTETNLGFLIEGAGFKALMGGQKANLVNLQASFPEIAFTRVRQTHGVQVFEATGVEMDYQVEADAQFTQTQNLGVCISTADCLPVLFYDSVTGFIGAIHAGWRGVAQQIVPKALQSVFQRGVMPGTLQVFIGPHIQRDSFEVDWEVGDQLLTSIDVSHKDKSGIYFKSLSREKTLIDLGAIMHQQLKMCGIVFDHILDLQIDTKTDPRFHSHRRDREKAGRQLSFIAKI